MDTERNVRATPLEVDGGTVLTHLLECSECGPVGIAVGDLWLLMSRAHLATHNKERV